MQYKDREGLGKLLYGICAGSNFQAPAMGLQYASKLNSCMTQGCNATIYINTVQVALYHGNVK